MKYVLGLDLGLSTGYAVINTSGIVRHGCWTNKAPGEGKKHENKSCRQQLRFKHFYETLNDLLTSFPEITHVAYEYVWSHTSTAQTQLYGGWRALTLASCGIRNLRCSEIVWSKIKSELGTNGKQPPELKAATTAQERREVWKKLSISKCYDKFGVTPENDDVADAIWVAYLALRGK